MIQLSCESCGSLLDSEENEIAFVCQNCGQGYLIDEGHLRKIDVMFASPSLEEPGREIRFYPFWLLSARVNIANRSSKGAILGMSSSDRGIQTFDFYIPAFELPLESLRPLALALTRSNMQLDLAEGEGKALRDCVRSEEFAKGLADFIFLSMEAEKSDKMRSIDYDIEFQESRLVALPFVDLDGGKKKDMISGMEVKGW